MRLLAGTSLSLDQNEVDDNFHAWCDVEATDALRKSLASLKNPECIKKKKLGNLLKATLRPYQSIGLHWLDFVTSLKLGACLADDMGLGKTIQIIALLLTKKEQKAHQSPSILILPASLLNNWKAEIECFAPSINALRPIRRRISSVA